MRLVHKSTGEEVKINDEVTGFRGNKMYVTGWQKPRSAASEGHIHVSEYKDLSADKRMTLGQSYYASCYDCEWIEREDRANPEPFRIGYKGQTIEVVGDDYTYAGVTYPSSKAAMAAIDQSCQ